MENLTLLALLQIAICLFLGVGILYLTFAVLHKTIIKKYDIPQDNIAFSIFTAGVLLSVAILLKSILNPSLTAFTVLKSNGLKGFDLFLESTKYGGLFVFLGISLASLINIVTVLFFTSITRGLDEFKEISENNIAVGILTAVITIAVAILCQDGLEFLIETFIPYPDMQMD